MLAALIKPLVHSRCALRIFVLNFPKQGTAGQKRCMYACAAVSNNEFIHMHAGSSVQIALRILYDISRGCAHRGRAHRGWAYLMTMGLGWPMCTCQGAANLQVECVRLCHLAPLCHLRNLQEFALSMCSIVAFCSFACK